MAKEKTQDEYNYGVTAETIQEQTISSLVQICYQYFMPNAGNVFFKSTTKFYTIVRTIALRLGETERAKELREIYTRIKVNDKKILSLPVAQYIYNRDVRFGYSPDHSYEGRAIKLMEIIIAIEEAEQKIGDIFSEICVKNNIDVSAELVQKPVLEGGNMERL